MILLGTLHRQLFVTVMAVCSFVLMIARLS
jgi:hypothetical protein